MTGDASPATPGAPTAASAPHLTLPSEPLELRLRVRQAVLGGSGFLESTGEDHGLSAWLWEQWGTALGSLGVGRGGFDTVVAGYRRELWFWVLGERTWEQAVGGLAGRLLRRAPVS